MNGHLDLGDMVKERLACDYTITQMDIGDDARLSKSGTVLFTESYEVEGVGHLCILRMRAMLGLMKMETVVLAPMEKDAPLINLDWIGAAGKETQIAELYDTQLEPYPSEFLQTFERIKERDKHLADYSSGAEHWYDSILYDCSYHKTGKKASYRLARAARDFFYTYADQLMSVGVFDKSANDKVEAPAASCDEEKKAAKVRAFAETLYSQGGPAVDQMKKLFGDDTAKRLILNHMYGVRETQH